MGEASREGRLLGSPLRVGFVRWDELNLAVVVVVRFGRKRRGMGKLSAILDDLSRAVPACSPLT